MISGTVKCYGKVIRKGKKCVCPHIDFCDRYADPRKNRKLEFMDKVPFQGTVCIEYRKKLSPEEKKERAMLSRKQLDD